MKFANLIVKRGLFLLLLIILIVELHSFSPAREIYIERPLQVFKVRPLMKPSAPTDCRIPCHTVSRRRLSCTDLQ